MLCLTGTVQSQDAKAISPRVTAVEPAALVRGNAATLKLRGFELKQAKQLRFPSASAIAVVLKEAGDAPPAKGLDNNQVGGTQIVAEFTLPADLPTGLLDFVVTTPAGETSGKIMVLAADAVLEEHEPNDGFRDAQPVRLGQSVRGAIPSDKDVDVFAFPARVGQSLRIAVTSGGPLLMDAEVACYNERGQFLAAADDDQTRDPVVTLTTTNDGSLLICVSSAHDVGGAWQSYWLTIEEVK